MFLCLLLCIVVVVHSSSSERNLNHILGTTYWKVARIFFASNSNRSLRRPGLPACLLAGLAGGSCVRDLRVLMRVVILVQNMQYQVTSHFTQIVQLINKTQSDKHSVSSKYLVIQLFWNSKRSRNSFCLFFFHYFKCLTTILTGFLSFFLAFALFSWTCLHLH